jgi:hypothetical protein
MRPIQTIRLFKGKFVGINFPERKYDAIPHRIAMKLRELGYSLDGFDHLYINFTVDAVENGMEFSKYIDSFHPWFRIYNIQVSEALFDTLESPESYDAILSLIESALVRISPKDEDLVHRAVAEALEKGEQMLMLRKQKQTSTRRAAIYLRCLDDESYLPLLQVYDMEDNLLFEADLPKTYDLLILGEIQVSTKRVTVKPRKNVVTEMRGMKPISFDY